MAIKLDGNFVSKFIANKGGELLTPYVSCEIKLNIRCIKHNYIWHPTWSSLKEGTWCPKCAKNCKVLIEEIQKFIENKNGIIIDSSNYLNAKSKIIIKCLKDDYTWEATWDHLSHGSWCIRCIGKELLTIEELSNLITSKNGTLLEIPKKLCNITKLKIKCNKDNYIWAPAYSSIVNSTRWCPLCAGAVIRPFDEINSLVISKGGILLSNQDKLINSKSILYIKCLKGHIFDRSYSNLLHGGFCPHCRSYNSQQKLCNILSDILNSPVESNFKGFKWLKNKRTLEVDIWFPELKLAIEFDGIQHFRPTRFSRKQTEKDILNQLKELKKRDRLKTRLIKKHPEEIQFFIRFNYKEKIDKEYVLKKLKKYKVI